MTLTIAIVIITCLISYRAIQDRSNINTFAHWPYAEIRNKEWYRFLTSGFIHNDFMHLGINMFVLWQFGTQVEHQFEYNFGTIPGKLIYLALYITTIIAAGIPSYLKHKDNQSYRAVGASGAVSGVFLVCALFAPWHTVLLMGIIPMPFILAAVGFLFYEQYASKKVQDNIGHDAHFYGAIYAVLFTIIIDFEYLNVFIRKLINGFPF